MYCNRMTSRISLQEMQHLADSISGELLISVKNEYNVWAEVKSRNLSQAQQGAIAGEATMGLQTFVIRYRALDSETWRVKDDTGDIWDIVDIPRQIGRKQGLELLCKRTGKKEPVGIIDLQSLIIGGPAGVE